MQGCLTESTLAALLDGELSDSERSAVEAHLDGCPDCLTFVARAAEASVPERRRGFAVGRYLILDAIGAGGMGVVYAAFDPELDRKVALKLLHPDPNGDPAASSARLQKEARAMARLSHPNVISVHDVGTTEDQVFVAMELVDGPTLRDWLHNSAPTGDWRRVLPVFIAAGRGLQVAHEAGLVHRDFKPENVLIGKEGRVRVTDFGLARLLDSPGAEFHPPKTEATRLETGTSGGTLAYMAPEQIRGQAISPSADQFSFCVALYEALFGHRPFGGAGDSAGAIVAAIESEHVPVPAGPVRVPTKLWAALRRGLRARPEERWPSMKTLLDELELTLKRRSREALVAVLIGCALLGAIGLDLASRRRAPAAPVCTDSRRELAGIWDQGVRDRIRAAFERSGRPQAKDLLPLVLRRLDHYADGWAAMHRETCEATRLRGVQSEAVLDRRMLCLGDKRSEIEAEATVLAQADDKTIEQAVEGLDHLSGLDACASQSALRSTVAPPETAIRGQVVAVGKNLSQAQALYYAGKVKPAQALTSAAVAAAERLQYGPLLARALLWRGKVEEYTAAKQETVVATYLAALAAGLAARDDRDAALSALGLLFFEGSPVAKIDDGWNGVAEGLVRRLNGDRVLEADLHWARMMLYEVEGKETEATQEARTTVELESALDELQHPERAEHLAFAQNLISASLANRGRRFAEAEARLRQTLSFEEANLDPVNWIIASTTMMLGEILEAEGRFQEALGYHQRALAISEALPMARGALKGRVRGAIGYDLAKMGKPERGLPLCEQARQELEAEAPGDPQLAIVLAQLGSAALAAGDLPRAEASFERGRALLKREAHTELFGLDALLRGEGDVLFARGRYREALARYTQSVAAAEKAPGGSLDEALLQLGRTYVALGEPERARPPLERALRIGEETPGDPKVLDHTRQALAQARAAP